MIYLKSKVKINKVRFNNQNFKIINYKKKLLKLKQQKKIKNLQLAN